MKAAVGAGTGTAAARAVAAGELHAKTAGTHRVPAPATH
jgi:hypothetical protein